MSLFGNYLYLNHSLLPGPLELIQKDILHTEDSSLEQAVKEGQITFTPTKEGVPGRFVAQTHKYLTKISFDEDSNSDAQSPPDLQCVIKSESSDR